MKQPNKPDWWRLFIIASLTAVCTLAILVIVPNFPHSGPSRVNECINNLRQIDGAARQFAIEHNLTNGAPIHFPDDLINYIKLNRYGKIPSCPDGGIYVIEHVGDTPTCSLSNAVPAHRL